MLWRWMRIHRGEYEGGVVCVRAMREGTSVPPGGGHGVVINHKFRDHNCCFTGATAQYRRKFWDFISHAVLLGLCGAK